MGGGNLTDLRLRIILRQDRPGLRIAFKHRLIRRHDKRRDKTSDPGLGPWFRGMCGWIRVSPRWKHRVIKGKPSPSPDKRGRDRSVGSSSKRKRHQVLPPFFEKNSRVDRADSTTEEYHGESFFAVINNSSWNFN